MRLKKGDVVRFKRDNKTLESFFRYEAKLGLVFTVNDVSNSFEACDNGYAPLYKLDHFDHLVNENYLEKVNL
jgi:hypothetical protein